MTRMDAALDALFRRLNRLNAALDREGRGINLKMWKIIRKIELRMLAIDEERTVADR